MYLHTLCNCICMLSAICHIWIALLPWYVNNFLPACRRQLLVLCNATFHVRYTLFYTSNFIFVATFCLVLNFSAIILFLFSSPYYIFHFYSTVWLFQWFLLFLLVDTFSFCSVHKLLIVPCFIYFPYKYSFLRYFCTKVLMVIYGTSCALIAPYT